MSDTRERFIVKELGKGTFGVYDRLNGSYPVQTPLLREAGIDRMEWFSENATAEEIAALLNTLHHGLTTKAPKAPKVTNANDDDDSLRVLADALIQSEQEG